MLDLQSYLNECAGKFKIGNMMTDTKTAADGTMALWNVPAEMLRGVRPEASLQEFQSWPYRATCQLQITFPDGAQGIGSGTLFGSFEQVLTCAHNLYSPEHGGYASSIRVLVPDPMGKTIDDKIEVMAYPVKANDKYSFVDTKWKADTDFNVTAPVNGKRDTYADDWGMLTLKTEFKVLRENKTYQGKVGFVTGVMNQISTTALAVANKISTVGYPVDASYHMAIGAGQLQELDPARPLIRYDVPAAAGQSGGPVFADLNLANDFKGFFQIGVHNSHTPGTNPNISAAARFNVDRINTMRDFISKTAT